MKITHRSMVAVTMVCLVCCVVIVIKGNVFDRQVTYQTEKQTSQVR